MKTKLLRRTLALLALLLSTLIHQPSTSFAQGTAFTYQGRLNSGTNLATGSYDLTFALFSVSSGAGQVGSTITHSATVVSNGLFTVALDFGQGIFTGPDRWLEVAVRTNGGGAFTTLTPRQKITPTPYAITAGNLTGTVSAGGLAGTYSGAVTFNNAANSFVGAHTGNGANVTNLNASNLASGTVPNAALSNAWKTTGNAGTTAGLHFLGTTDNQALELKVNGSRTLRLEFNTNSFGGAPNLIGGAPVNFVPSAAVGATISGGGTMDYFGVPQSNSVLSDFGTVGGGFDNRIAPSALAGTIAGGRANDIGTNSSYSAIGGGGGNDIAASALYATIAGGDRNGIGAGGYSAIGGGFLNKIAVNAVHATIAGGRLNDIGTNSSYSVIGGGDDNNIAVLSDFATIAGGLENNIGTNSYASTIGGGYRNVIGNNAGYATIPGGQDNAANGGYSFAAGRRAKANHDGTFVWADSTSGEFASSGNHQFLVRASSGVGINVTNPLDSLHVQSDSSLRVRTTATGTGYSGFLSENSLGEWFAGVANGTNHWYVYENAPVAGARLVVKSGGNVGIGTLAPTNKLHVIGGVSATVFVTTSDRNAKENFAPVSPREVLDKLAALPITTWSFKTMSDGRHIGPMAQDFYAAFGLGGSDTTITSIDSDGVALAAIQGLNQKLEETRAASKTKDAEIESLKQSVAELKRQVESLAARE
jgi:hypothetical protein